MCSQSFHRAARIGQHSPFQTPLKPTQAQRTVNFCSCRWQTWLRDKLWQTLQPKMNSLLKVTTQTFASFFSCLFNKTKWDIYLHFSHLFNLNRQRAHRFHGARQTSHLCPVRAHENCLELRMPPLRDIQTAAVLSPQKEWNQPLREALKNH